MTDQYLTWIETSIDDILATKKQMRIDNTNMPKLARDIERILETLESCKSMYLKYHQKDKAS